MERPSSAVNNRVADGFSGGASAFCAFADAAPIRHTRPQARAKRCPPMACHWSFIPRTRTSCRTPPQREALSSRKHLRLGLAMELALSVTTAAGSGLPGYRLDLRGRSRFAPTINLECPGGTGVLYFLFKVAAEAT